jgi:hypothetical protein
MPRRNRRRKVVAAVGAGAALMAVAIAFIPIGNPGEMSVPTPPGVIVRIDLLATRDLNVNGDLPAGGTADNKPLVADQSWTRTGGDSCYPISSTDASCFEDSEVAYTVDATGIGWVVEPSATNRILYSTAIDCTNWTCRGTASATALQTSPDGGATATTITVGTGTNDVFKSATGYAVSTLLTMRFWIKCSTGTPIVQNPWGAGIGKWSIDCSAIGGAWALLTESSASVTEVSAFCSDGSGNAGSQFLATSGTVTASIWAPTLTEEPGTGLAVIPTAASAVSTGDVAWRIDNDPAVYWKSGDTITQTLTEIAGTCLTTSATQIYMSGAPGSECSGIWYALQVTNP